MADIRLTAGDDPYVQPESDKDSWNNVFGEAGHDVIRMYQGTAIGGPGNDRIEKLADPTNANRELQAAYWNAGDNLRVNLAEGWAEDGEGGRDTLVGVSKIHGSGSANAWVQGDDKDNYYWPNGGTDTFVGGGGWDGISLNSWFEPAAGQPWRQALFDEINIRVSADGRQATITPKTGRGFGISTTDVEAFDALVDAATNTWQSFRFADFITPQAMAEDALVAGGAMRWNASQPLGSAVTVTFSFVKTAPASGVGASGFRAFTPAEEQMVRDILAMTSRVAQIDFREVTEAGSSVGQLRFGVSQQTSTKGQTWLPGTNGDQAGDVWMDVESMSNIATGNEGWQALLHEIGHALGLRHPRNVDPGDAWAMQLLPQFDRLPLTVMSQTPSADGLFRADWGPLDVLALRTLYGARSDNAGPTTYELGTREGAAMSTLVDDGGIDVLDASRLTSGVTLDLVPGHLGSAGITPTGYTGIDNLGIAATTWIENAIGSALDDVLIRNSLANEITGGRGNDWIEGGAGVDTAVFAGRRTDYEIANGFGKVFVKARDGISGFDTLLGIEQLRFADLTLVLAASVLGADVRLTVDEDASLVATLPEPGDLARSAASWTLVSSGANGSASVSAAGELRYTPLANFAGTDFVTFDIKSAGGTGNRYVAFIDVVPVNDPPVLANALPDRKAYTSASFSYQIPLSAFSDRDTGDTLVYSATRANGTALPTWLTFDAATRTFGGTPKVSDVGALEIRVTATDSGGASVSDLMKVDVESGSGDTLDPAVLSYSPSPGSATVAPSAHLSLVFNEPVQFGSGTLALKTAAGALVQSFGPGAAGLSIVGSTFTLNPSADLLHGIAYRVEIPPNFVTDTAGNGYAGTTDWTFTTSGRTATGTPQADRLQGSPGADDLSGLDGRDTLEGLAGNDTLAGGTGVDTSVHASSRAAATLERTANGWSVSSSADGRDALTGIERLAFVDVAVALDLGEKDSAGQAALLLGAAIGRNLMVAKKELLGVVIDFFDTGYTLPVLAGALMRLPVWDLLAGSNTPQAIGTYLHTVVHGRAPSPAELSAAVTVLTTQPQGTYLAELAASSVNQQQIGLVGLQQSGLEFVLPPDPGG